jgi:hypothetical protein
VLVLLALTGCGHMPVASMVRLSRVDLQTTDPARLRVGVKVPEAVTVQAEGTVLRIAVRLADGSEQARDFSLREVTDGSELRSLAGEASASARIFAFALSESDIGQLRLFRAALIARQKGGSGGAITIAVRPQACRTGALPAGAVLFTTYLRTAETGDYVPLARDLDLRAIGGGDIAALMPPCSVGGARVAQ